LENKTLHGRHPHDLEQNHIDTIASNKWLKIGSLFPETEGFYDSHSGPNNKHKKIIGNS